MNVHIINAGADPVHLATSRTDESPEAVIVLAGDVYEVNLADCTRILIGDEDPLRAAETIEAIVTNEDNTPVMVLPFDETAIELGPEITCQVSAFGYIEIVPVTT